MSKKDTENPSNSPRSSAAPEISLPTLYSAVEQCADLIIIADDSGRIEYVNPAFETLTGYSKEECSGKHPAF